MAEHSVRETLSDLSKLVVRLRDKEGKPWHEISGEAGESAGKCMLAYEFAKVTPADRVTAKNDAEMARKIVNLRSKDKISWGRISARTDLPESRCRTLFETIKGEGSTKGDRIGKGGRYPGTSAPTKKATTKKAATAKRAPKKAPSKKGAPAKKTAGAKKSPRKKTAGARKASGGNAGGPSTANGEHPFSNLSYDELADRLEGRPITVASTIPGGKDRTFKVKAVRKLTDRGELEFSEAANGSVHTVRVSDIKRAGK